ncbi:MAG: ribosome biogenesis GTPase Der [Alphaproteobacteria bacterium]|nr:ribosome biogenesis GTPase Der [Alphaproteobacteria bacterium]
MSKLKTIAVVGRTNVGKSTLFNRFVGKKQAIVHDMPGVTRDRKEGIAALSDICFRVIDTAGLETKTALSKAMWEQTQKAIDEADIVLMVVDARSEINPLDMQLAQDLRRLDKPVFLLANKCEAKEQYLAATEAYRLGLGDPIAVSAEHGLGMLDLYQALLPYFPKEERGKNISKNTQTDADDNVLKLAIVGRPNVGKSTLVNQLLGQERMLTGPEAGVTRDAISIPFEWRGRKVMLTDTAGLRKRAKITQSLEKISAADSRHALNFAQVVVVVVDANTPLETQDLTVARKVVEEGRALILAVNKWDTIKNSAVVKNAIKERLHDSLQQVKGLPVVYISAKTGQGMDLLMKEVFRIYNIWNKRVPTAKLNLWLKAMTEATPPPLASNGRRIPMKYMTQVNTRPPTFVIFSSNPDELPESYLRYLSNGLRKDYGLDGIPIRISMRKRANPYAEKGKKKN